MDDRQVWRLMSTCIFVFFLLAGSSAMNSPKLVLESTVFVAFAGEDVLLHCELTVPVNQNGVLTCSDPQPKTIYSCPINNTAGQPNKVPLELKNVTLSGEYRCSYETARVYLFLRVRSKEECKADLLMNYTEIGVVGAFTAVLLVFSVVGSVYVFRGSWSDRLTKCGEHGRKQNQKREERKEGEEDNVDVITAPSTSFYASLEPRPRSIYDVLDQSAFRGEPDRSKAKPKKREPREMDAQTKQDQQEGVIECVYENF